MKGIFAGLATFTLLALLVAVFIYPPLFGFIQHAFTSPDVGAIVAILVLFFISGFIIYLVAAIAIFVAALVEH